MLTISSDPTDNNHILSQPNARIVFVRDTLSDWHTQFPNRLRIRRLDGPPVGPPLSDAALASRAISILRVEVPYWLKFFDENNYHNAPSLSPRAGGWGHVATNWYKLQEDEVLVVKLAHLDAAYLGFQLADVWGVTADYITYTTSLNNSQAKPNRDGTFSYVVSPKDPGVWNWLDSRGMHMGLFTIRWQCLAHPASSPNVGIQSMQVVKISELRGVLPAETTWVGAAEREAQRSERAVSFMKRLQN